MKPITPKNCLLFLRFSYLRKLQKKIKRKYFLSEYMLLLKFGLIILVDKQNRKNLK